MKRSLKKSILSISLSILVGFTGTSTRADDTEIYTGGNFSSGTIQPNVLFVLDTSGSMGSTAAGSSPSISRMQSMKNAFNAILDSTSGINIGLMRFNDDGGPILYPVKDIDSTTNSIDLGGGKVGYQVDSAVVQSSDDAEELQVGTVALDEVTLDMAARVNELDTTALTTVAYPIVANTDDAGEQFGTTYLNDDSNYIYPNYTVGTRFQNVTVPSGPGNGGTAQIANAYIRYRSSSGNTGDVDFKLYAEDSLNPVTFAATTNNITARASTEGTAEVPWNTLSNWVYHDYYDTPDISSVVQYLIDQAGWVSGNAMSFIAAANPVNPVYNWRRLRMRDYATNSSAVLNVTYGTSTLADVLQTTGVRFQDLGIPQGAVINSATLEFTAKEASAVPAAVVVNGEDVGSSVTFTTTANDVTGRTLTTASTNWTPAAYAKGETLQVDVKDVVQEIVGATVSAAHPWCGSNNMSFIISGADLTKNLQVFSFDADASLAPKLRVVYEEQAVGSEGCLIREIVRRVSDVNDDAEEAGTGSVSLTGNVLNMDSSQTNGLRFTNLPLKQGATVLSATIDFTADSGDSSSVNLTIKGQDHVSGPAFTSATNDITGRTPTSASVGWSPGTWTSGEVYTSPDLKSIMNEILALGTWAPDNPMVFIQTNSTGERRAKTHERDASQAPLLRIRVNQTDLTGTQGVTVRETVRAMVNDFNPAGMTPLVDVAYEAARYFRGESMDYGAYRGPSGAGSRRQNFRVSHDLSFTGGKNVKPSGCTDDNLFASACVGEVIADTPDATYVSPITQTCQANYVVLLSDGTANNNHSTSKIQTMIGSGTCDSANSGEFCGRDLADYMYTVDQSPLSGTQTVKTYTIGFNVNPAATSDTTAVTYLKEVAQEGGGEFYTANTASDLVDAFQKILATILQVDSTFVAPAVSVNAFNRLTHNEDIYFALFRPGDSPRWPGNVKHYKLAGDPVVLTDANDNPAVDVSTGFFADTSRCMWTPAGDPADGANVSEGGSTSLLTTSRTIYTYTGNSDPNGEILTSAANAFHESNAALTDSLLGIGNSGDPSKSDLVQWARGIDLQDEDEDGATNDARRSMGDPLHSTPSLITYGGTEANPDITMFLGDNQGYMRAINADTGVEVFSFIPQELLPNLKTYYEDVGGTARTYGLDGQVASRVNDLNGNGLIYDTGGNLETGEFAQIFYGMRRGGRNYYAMDVTDRAAPRLMGMLEGGNTSTKFKELGQSWSKMVVTKIKLNGVDKKALIFGGGYDTNQDAGGTATSTDSMGRAVYIVDADSGNVLWWGGKAGTGISGANPDLVLGMDYAVPSEVRAIDVNFDGYADRVYFGDMGGQVWRIDFDINGNTGAANFATGGKIADLNGNATTSNRRFYYAPDVALLTPAGKTPFLNIAIGSGYRAHPMEQVIQDRFYSLRDYDIYNTPASYTTLTESDLTDVTDNLIYEGANATIRTTAQAALDASDGWFIELKNGNVWEGEKILAESITIDNKLIFTSYRPTVGSSTSCEPSQGQGRAYLVNAYDGGAVMDMDNDGDKQSDDRYIDLTRGGIPPDPTVLFPPGKDPIVLVGPEILDGVTIDNVLRRTYWQEVQ